MCSAEALVSLGKKCLMKNLLYRILSGCCRALESWRVLASSWGNGPVVWMATCLQDCSFDSKAKDTKLCFTIADMDECSFSEFLCQHECVNGPGSYYCTCPSGYNLLDDSRSCQGNIPALIKTPEDQKMDPVSRKRFSRIEILGLGIAQWNTHRGQLCNSGKNVITWIFLMRWIGMFFQVRIYWLGKSYTGKTSNALPSAAHLYVFTFPIL